jgi:hypothetical protein
MLMRVLLVGLRALPLGTMFQIGVADIANGVQHGEVTGWFRLKHLPERFVPFHDRLQQLQPGGNQAGAVDDTGIKFANEIGGEFRLGKTGGGLTADDADLRG